MKKSLRVMLVLLIIVFGGVCASMTTILGLNSTIVLEEEIHYGDKSIVEGLNVELIFHYQPWNSFDSVCTWKVIHSPGKAHETKTECHYITKTRDYDISIDKSYQWSYTDYDVVLSSDDKLTIFAKDENGNRHQVLMIDLREKKLADCIGRFTNHTDFDWNGERLVMAGINSKADVFISVFEQNDNVFYATYDNCLEGEPGDVWIDDETPIRIYWD